MTRAQPRFHRGFTIIEVIVAMAVIALGIGALLTTLTTSADTIVHLRDRSFAEWVALNQISDTRLDDTVPGVGVTSGEVDYAGSRWLWRQEVVDQGVAGILRLDVRVARFSVKAKNSVDSPEDFPSVATAYGFISTEASTPNALDPTWSQTVPRTPGSPNP